VAGSMILAGVLLKLGGYGLVRVAGLVNPSLISPGVVTIGLVGGRMAGLICLGQVDAKSLVAYSSVGHMGVAAAGAVSCTSAGLGGAYSILICHGLCSSGLFCMVNFFYERTTRRSIIVIKGLMVLFPPLILL
jgi:NADH-ubiquinone oxidoreductase chain 4